MVRGPGGLLALGLVIPLDGDGGGHAAESQTSSDNQLNHVFLLFVRSNLITVGLDAGAVDVLEVVADPPTHHYSLPFCS